MKRILLIILLFALAGKSYGTPLDSAYMRDPFFVKLVKTNSKVPIFYNEQVKRQIGVYIRNLNNSTAILIGKVQYYKNLYGSHFDSAGIPAQLFLGSAAYSQCDPLYTDLNGGSGMWALSYAIAKKYKLTTNSYVDERRNPDISSQAAVRYFADLHNIYGDWLKALVAFRCGPINMNMAIRKAGNTLDYARIHNALSADHQNAAVQYMAFWYIWNHYQEHRIQPLRFRLPETDTVHVQGEIGLNAIAYNLGLSEEVLKLCNAELRLDIVPLLYNSKGLRLPKDKITEYHGKLNILFPPQVVLTDSTLTDSIIMDNNGLLIRPMIRRDSMNTESSEQEEEEPSSPVRVKTPPKISTITYTVKQGDGLLLLADLFDCRVSDIRKWNGMKKDNIFKGQKLKIKVPSSKVAQYKKINSMTMSQKKKLAKKS